jgi:hypothetical protein
VHAVPDVGQATIVSGVPPNRSPEAIGTLFENHTDSEDLEPVLHRSRLRPRMTEVKYGRLMTIRRWAMSASKATMSSASISEDVFVMG